MRLFITGISGLLGLNAALQLRREFEVSGCYLRHPVRIPDVETARVDLTDPVAVQDMIRRASPEIVIHAAGLTAVDDCQRDPALARRLNVEASRGVAQAAAARGAKLVHISTDNLFDGRALVQREDDPPSPLNAYAESKLEAERVVAAACPEALVVRTNFYGWGPPHRPSFSDWILDGLLARRTLPVFQNIHFSPILVNDLIEAIRDLARAEASGVYNVAGAERVTKHSFALQLAAAFGLDPSPIRAVQLKDVPLLAPRPLESALDSTRAERVLGRRMPASRDGLDRLRKLQRDGWPQEVRACTPAQPTAVPA